MFDDEIWDEDQWESFLKKDDDRVARYMKLLNRFLAEYPLPKVDDPAKDQEWKDAFNAYLIQHGLVLDDMEHELLEEDGDSVDEDGAMHFDVVEEDIDLEEEFDSFESLQQLPVYQKASALTSEVLSWSDTLPVSIKDGELVQFCSNIMQVTANIAKGHGMGYDREVLGGNIACLKRGIKSANAALELLREMKSRSYLPAARYLELYEQTYEVRNAVGLYIQELRDRFNLGID